MREYLMENLEVGRGGQGLASMLGWKEGDTVWVVDGYHGQWVYCGAMWAEEHVVVVRQDLVGLRPVEGGVGEPVLRGSSTRPV